MTPLSKRLTALFDAERAARALHAELSRADRNQLVPALRKEIASALALPAAEEGEATLRLVRMATLLGEIEGGDVVDALIEILANGEAEARHAAGEALCDHAYDRFKEVALGIERALDKLPVGSPALTELPYMLAEVGEPGCIKLLGRFLKHKDPEAVSAAIEALVELADPSAASLLEPLTRDTRQVELDEQGEVGQVTIGDLATEARELLIELADKS